jgi:hypothetical protein
MHRRRINISGLNHAPVSNAAPAPGRAPAHTGSHSSRRVVRDFSGRARTPRSIWAGHSNDRKKCSGVITLAASLTTSDSGGFRLLTRSGTVGPARCAPVGLPLSPGIFAALSVATIAAPLPGSVRCSSAGVSAGDENAVRILSADTTASAAGALNTSADPLDFRNDL